MQRRGGLRKRHDISATTIRKCGLKFVSLYIEIISSDYGITAAKTLPNRDTDLF